MNHLKKVLLVLIYVMGISLVAEAANTGKEINNKCRNNLKKLNAATAKMLSESNYYLQQWTDLKQAQSTFLADDKYLGSEKIEGPTKDCEYFLVSIDNNDYQWLCQLHGVIDGDKTLSFRYHEHQLQAKTSSRYMNIENYKKHNADLLRWTEYAPTPSELFKYHYNMNPITTSILSVIVLFAAFFTLKAFFRF